MPDELGKVTPPPPPLLPPSAKLYVILVLYPDKYGFKYPPKSKPRFICPTYATNAIKSRKISFSLSFYFMLNYVITLFIWNMPVVRNQ